MSPYGAYTAQDKSMNQFSCTHFHCSTLSFTPTDQTLYMTDYGGMVNVYAGDIMMKYVADLEPGEGGHIVKMSSFPVKRSPKDNIALSNHHQWVNIKYEKKRRISTRDKYPIHKLKHIVLYLCEADGTIRSNQIYFLILLLFFIFFVTQKSWTEGWRVHCWLSMMVWEMGSSITRYWIVFAVALIALFIFWLY